jgi:two-component system sensor histidine kinase PilS (NtrC family)
LEPVPNFLLHRLRWLIALRLVAITSVALPYLLLQLTGDGAVGAGRVRLESFHLFAGAIYILSLVYLVAYEVLGRWPLLQAYLQFVGDCAATTVLVYLFGGAGSPFSMLYLIVIGIAAAILPRTAALAVGAIAYLGYAGLALGLQIGMIPPHASGAGALSPRLLGYNLAMHFAGFLAMSLLTSYLAAHARRAEDEVRRLQDQMRLHDRMAAVGEMAAGIAHEIGNPLAAISGSVQMLRTAAPDEATRRRLLDIVLEESQRLDRTIKGFLRFARPRERSVQRFDIAHLLLDHAALLRNSSEVSPRHRLEIAIEPPAFELDGDPDQISQVFWNLVRNALRAMPDGGTLRLEARPAGDGYLVEVIDDGRGMTPEERARMFQPFQSFFDGGSGIGMAIVYRIVQEHGGTLAVRSESGRGSRVSISLPVPAPVPVAAARARAPQPAAFATGGHGGPPLPRLPGQASSR